MWKCFMHYTGLEDCAEHLGSACTPGLDTPSGAPGAEDRQEAGLPEKCFAPLARHLPSESRAMDGDQCRAWHWDAWWHRCFSATVWCFGKPPGSDARLSGCQGSQQQAVHQQDRVKYLNLSCSDVQKQAHATGWFYDSTTVFSGSK